MSLRARISAPRALPRGNRSRTRRLLLEALEDRSLLTTAALPFPTVGTSLVLDTTSYHPSRVLVGFKPGAEAAGDLRWHGTPVASAVPLAGGLWEVNLPPGTSVASAVASLGGSFWVNYVEPDYTVRLATVPSDPQFSSLWGMNNTGQTGGTIDADIDAPEAWDLTTGSSSTIVAVIDTGVDYNHPDLAANIWTNPGEIPGDNRDNDGNGFVDDVHGYDFINSDGNPLDDQGHGTHVAGTIGAVANNGIGVAGINWNVQIMALKFLGADGSGSISDAIRALDYAVQMGAHISNNSYGDAEFSQAFADAIAAAGDVGHIFVAAAGNNSGNNDASPFYPASFDAANIISVAATDDNDRLASFSNYGVTSVDLAAPGVNILSTTPGNNYESFSGTSMASPTWPAS
jgi:subtilisin family serine protease